MGRARRQPQGARGEEPRPTPHERLVSDRGLRRRYEQVYRDTWETEYAQARAEGLSDGMAIVAAEEPALAAAEAATGIGILGDGDLLPYD
jgi:hypothetical protein